MCLGTKTERPVWRNANNASAQNAKVQNTGNAVTSEVPSFANIANNELGGSKWLFYDDRAYNSPGSDFDYDAKTVSQSNSSPSTESEFGSDGSEAWRDVRSDSSFYGDNGMGFASHNPQQNAYAGYRMAKAPSGYGSFNYETFNGGSFHGAFETPFQAPQEASPPMNDFKYGYGYRVEPPAPVETKMPMQPVHQIQTSHAHPVQQVQHSMDSAVAMQKTLHVPSAVVVPVSHADTTVKAERKSASPSAIADSNGSRSYRQQTSELINKLDKLLKFPAKQAPVKGRACKGKSRRSPKDLMKPRPRNVVLKQAVELIWRIKCDEEALALREQESANRDRDSDTTMSPASDSTTELQEPETKDVKEVKESKETLANSESAGMNVETDVFLTKWVASFDPRDLSKCSSSSPLDIIDDSGFQWDQGDSDPVILSLFREQPMYGREGPLFGELPCLSRNPPPPI